MLKILIFVRNEYVCLHAGNNTIRPLMLNDNHKNRYLYTKSKLMSEFIPMSCFCFSVVTAKTCTTGNNMIRYSFSNNQDRYVPKKRTSYVVSYIIIGTIYFLANSKATGDDLL